MVIASDSILKDFNWILNMPLDQSQVVKSGNAIIDHSVAREQTALQRDVRAPTFEFTFDLQRDEQAIKDAEQIAQSTSQLNLSAKGTSLSSTNLASTQKITFSKVQL